jgi:hypothetical protein
MQIFYLNIPKPHNISSFDISLFTADCFYVLILKIWKIPNVENKGRVEGK